MRVLRAQAMGLCFGVRDALDLVRSLDEPERVAIHGELVHNERILHELGRRGFQQTSEADRHSIPDADRVVITAHGVSNRELARLAAHESGERINAPLLCYLVGLARGRTDAELAALIDAAVAKPV